MELKLNQHRVIVNYFYWLLKLILALLQDNENLINDILQMRQQILLIIHDNIQRFCQLKIFMGQQIFQLHELVHIHQFLHVQAF